MEQAARTARRKKGRPTAAASPSASTGSATAGGVRWVDLPEGLLLSVFDRLPSVADLFAVAAVCRSWRALAGPPASAVIAGGRPPLLLSPVLDPVNPLDSSHFIDPNPGWWTYPCRCRLLSPADPAASYRCLVPPSALPRPLIGYSHGHLISLLGDRLLLADVVTGDELWAPELPKGRGRLHHAVLTAPLSAPDCCLLLPSTHSVLLRWRVGEREWSELPLGADMLSVNQITVFRGQILILDLLGRLFAVEFSPHFSVRQWPVKSFDVSTLCFRLPMRLVELRGELMLVRFSITAPDMPSVKVEVVRLDSSGPPSWVKVESLGEAALFIGGQYGSSVSCPNPSRWGGRSNCVYLALQGSDTWIVLPLDGEEIEVDDLESPFYLATNSSTEWPSPMWVYPSMLY